MIRVLLALGIVGGLISFEAAAKQVGDVKGTNGSWFCILTFTCSQVPDEIIKDDGRQ